MQEIIETVRGFDGALVVTPEAGSDFPALSWGDAYFYHAPDGRMPERTSRTERSSRRTTPTTRLPR